MGESRVVEPVRTPKAEPSAVRRGSEVRSVLLGWLLLLLCAVSLATSWAGGVHASTLDQLDQDRQAGSVVQWYRSPHVASESRWTLARAEWQESDGDPAERGGLLVWEARGRWWVTTAGLGLGTWTAEVAASESPEVAAAADALTAAGVRYAQPTVADGPGWPVPAMLVVWFAAFVGVRSPRRGNRWFWFWVALVPLGVGIAAYAVAERIHPRAEPAARRWSGWQGFGVSVAGSILLAACLTGLRAAGVPVPIG